MLKLKIIAFVLSLLMLMQMLPLAQIGQALGSNMWTEELPHGEDGAAKSLNTANFTHPFLPPQDYDTVQPAYSLVKALAYIHFSEVIPSNHSTEVVSPPPDFI